ncbi:MAG: hypothetical protein ACRDQW_18955 [Haloechinothrix sp.]
MNELVLSILVSAAVAAVVTLLIEYAAKPGLDARKDRILEEQRALRDMRTQLDLLMEHEREGWFPRGPYQPDEVEAANIARAGAEGDSIMALVVRCQDLLPEEIRRFLQYALNGWQTTIAPPFTSGSWEEFQVTDQIMNNLGHAIDITTEYLGLPWWRRRRKHRLRREAKARYAARLEESQEGA